MRRLGRGVREHEFVLQGSFQQGELAVVFDPSELPLHHPERRGTPAHLLIARPPVGHPAGAGLETTHDTFDEIGGLEAHA